MASIFTRIINGEIPGRIIWSDEHCVSMVDIRPLHPGHSLVIPRAEIDHWVDLEARLASHLMTVAHHVANAQKAVVASPRVGLMIAGFEVPHTHVHVVPMSSMAHLDFANARQGDPAELDAMADRLREALRDQGHTDTVV